MTAFDNPLSKRLLVVAHPDDEALWFAGLLFRYPGDWTIICCSQPKLDPVRSLKFQLSCAALGAKGRVIDDVETREVPLKRLADIDMTGFDVVVTHNRAGEYGHPHHIQIYEYICHNLPPAVELYTDGYGLGNMSASFTLALDDNEWAAKLKTIKCYDNPRKIGGIMMPTWEMLLTDLGARFNLRVESYFKE